MQRNRDLQSVRLACRGLRNYVDKSIDIVSLKLHGEDRRFFAKGMLPPFHRWSACTIAVLDLPPGSAVASNMLAMAFGRLHAQGQQPSSSIRRLKVKVPEETVLSGAAWSCAIRDLPNLQALTLSSTAAALPQDELEQRLIFDSLASLPDLRCLALPYHPSLELVHMLASSLQTLDINGDLYRDVPAYPSASFVESISRLHQLRYLTIRHLADNKTLCSLVRSLPASIAELELGWCTALTEPDMTTTLTTVLEMSSGCITLLGVCDENQFPVWGQFVRLASAMFPKCFNDQGKKTLQSIYIDGLEFHAMNLPTAAEVQQLRELLRGCQHVRLGTFCFARNVPPQTAADALLTFLPEVVHLAVDGFTREPDLRHLAHTEALHVDLEPLTKAAKQRQRALSGMRTAVDLALPSHSPSLAALALEIMVMEWCTPGGALAAPPSDSADGQRLLLLRGPLMAGLAADPEALDDFMRAHARQAADAVGVDAVTQRLFTYGGSDGMWKLGVFAYLPLPGAAASGAVLVQCATDAGQAALLCAGAELGGGVNGTDPQLQVLPLRYTPDWEPSCADAFRIALEKAGERVCNGEGLGAQWSMSQRLRWLLEGWAAVRDLERTKVVALTH